MCVNLRCFLQALSLATLYKKRSHQLFWDEIFLYLASPAAFGFINACSLVSMTKLITILYFNSIFGERQLGVRKNYSAEHAVFDVSQECSSRLFASQFLMLAS
jgi:hypothetical protein